MTALATLMRLHRTAAHNRPTFDRGADFFTDPARQCNPDRLAGTSDEGVFDSRLVADSRRAVELCKRCLFLQECDTWATENNEPWGIWGGVRRGRTDAA